MLGHVTVMSGHVTVMSGHVTVMSGRVTVMSGHVTVMSRHVTVLEFRSLAARSVPGGMGTAAGETARGRSGGPRNESGSAAWPAAGPAAGSRRR